jgi:hypothetical protein
LESAREQMRAALGNRQERRNLSQEERRQRMAKVRESLQTRNKEAEEKIAKILDEKQLARIRQLRLQRQGVVALAQPATAEKLGLDRDQKAKIREILVQIRGSLGNREPSAEDRDARMARLQERRQEAQAEILAVLDDAQREKWAEMKGEPFEFPRGRAFGGAGFRGRGNAGGRRGP